MGRPGRPKDGIYRCFWWTGPGRRCPRAADKVFRKNGKLLGYCNAHLGEAFELIEDELFKDIKVGVTPEAADRRVGVPPGSRSPSGLRDVPFWAMEELEVS